MYCRRAERRARQRLGVAAGRARAAAAPPSSAGRPPAGRRLGQAPVDDQGLAVGAEHDVGRLEVAVQDAPAVGIGDRVADVDEPAQQLAQLQGPLARAAGRPSARVERSMASLRLSPRMNRMA